MARVICYRCRLSVNQPKPAKGGALYAFDEVKELLGAHMPAPKPSGASGPATTATTATTVSHVQPRARGAGFSRENRPGCQCELRHQRLGRITRPKLPNANHLAWRKLALAL